MFPLRNIYKVFGDENPLSSIQVERSKVESSFTKPSHMINKGVNINRLDYVMACVFTSISGTLSREDKKLASFRLLSTLLICVGMTSLLLSEELKLRIQGEYCVADFRRVTNITGILSIIALYSSYEFITYTAFVSEGIISLVYFTAYYGFPEIIDDHDLIVLYIFPQFWDFCLHGFPFVALCIRKYYLNSDIQRNSPGLNRKTFIIYFLMYCLFIAGHVKLGIKTPYKAIDKYIYTGSFF